MLPQRIAHELRSFVTGLFVKIRPQISRRMLRNAVVAVHPRAGQRSSTVCRRCWSCARRKWRPVARCSSTMEICRLRLSLTSGCESWRMIRFPVGTVVLESGFLGPGPHRVRWTVQEALMLLLLLLPAVLQ